MFLDGFSAFYSFLEPAIDIIMMTAILYAGYQFLVRTSAMQIVRAVFVILAVYIVSYVLNLGAMMWILGKLTPVLALALVVVFQPEIRKLVLRLGQMNLSFFSKRTRHTYADAVVIAAQELSRRKKGMLVVFERGTRLDDIEAKGTRLNADISSALLVTIFSFETPLHDAACLVRDGKIVAAGCFLPLTDRTDIKKTFGTRHRAALGMSEQSDAVVLIVSEETGAMSLAYESKFEYDLTAEQLISTLNKLLDVTEKNRTIENTIDENTQLN